MRASDDVERLDASVREAKMWLRIFRCRMKRVVREAEHLLHDRRSGGYLV